MRRWLLLLALLLALPAPAAAAFTHVRSNCNTGNGVSSIVVTLGGTPSTNNLLVMASRTYSSNRDVSTVSDSGGGETWTEFGDVTDSVETFSRMHVWAALVVSGNTTITTTYSGSLSGDGWVCVYEFAGVNAADINDDASVSTVTATATSWPSGSLTTTNAESLLIGVANIANGGGAKSQDSAFSDPTGLDTTDGYMGYRIVSSTGGYQYTPTGASGDGFSLIAAFEGTGGGGGGTPHGRSSRGFGP